MSSNVIKHKEMTLHSSKAVKHMVKEVKFIHFNSFIIVGGYSFLSLSKD